MKNNKEKAIKDFFEKIKKDSSDDKAFKRLTKK